MSRDTILVVDDEEINRMLLEEIFRRIYKVIHAESGDKALELLKEHHDSLAAIVLDYEMPGMNGFQFLERVAVMPEAEQIPVIMTTAEVDSEVETHAFDLGVADLIRKPYHSRVVLKRVRNVVALYSIQANLQNVVLEQEEKLVEQARMLAKVNEDLIDALSSVVEFRDLETGEHILRIKSYTEIMCNNMLKLFPDCGLTPEKIHLIVAASSMHDIGKIAIPDAILLKPGKLTPEEFEVIKTHTTKGASLLNKVNIISDNNEYLNYCRNICLYHHEKYDGKGYPRGLGGEEIPLEAQIVSIADVFDALVSKRIYKEAYSIETSFDMINNGECGMFSDRIMKCFSESFNEFKAIAEDSFPREKNK